MTNPKTLRIACLHGFCQNAQVFRQKTGGLRKSLERNPSVISGATKSQHAQCGTSGLADPYAMAELVYIDAPFAFETRINPYDQAANKSAPPPVFKPSVSQLSIPTTTKLELDRTQRSWWTADSTLKRYVGWEQSLTYLRDKFREEVRILPDN